MRIVSINKGNLKQQEVKALLLRFNDAFTLPLVSQVADTERYSEKLAKYACFLVAEEDEKIIGFMAYYRNDELRQLYVTHVCVANAYQHKGIGGLMFERLESFSTQGYSSIGLEVNKENTKAYNFYKKHKGAVQIFRGKL